KGIDDISCRFERGQGNERTTDVFQRPFQGDWQRASSGQLVGYLFPHDAGYGYRPHQSGGSVFGRRQVRVAIAAGQTMTPDASVLAAAPGAPPDAAPPVGAPYGRWTAASSI